MMSGIAGAHAIERRYELYVAIRPVNSRLGVLQQLLLVLRGVVASGNVTQISILPSYLQWWR